MKRIITKKTIYQVVFGIALILTGCNESLLDQSNPNKLTPDSFWQNAEDAKANLTAVYSSFREQYYNRLIPMEFRGDDVEVTHGSAAFFQFNQFTLTDANSTCGTAWSQNYKGIFLANQAIHYIPGIMDMDEALKNRMVGEAKFLRAYYYFTLVLEFKNIPLITDLPKSSDEYNIAQSAPEDVFKQIEKDLTDAIAVLPNSYPTSEQGRITKGAALGYLGKCLLFQKKWQDAANTLKTIIDSGAYGLLSDFGDVFLEENDFNKELLCEVNYARGTSNGVNLGITDNKREAFSKAGGWYIFWPRPWLLDEMTKEKTVDGEYDPRLYATIIFPNTKMTYYGKTYSQLLGSSSTSIGWGKYSEWELSDKLKENTGKNTRLLRYADILLMYAECLTNLDKTDQAIPYVNMIRNRANLSSLSLGMNKNDLLLEIEHQRIIELADEVNRFFDLLRWNGNITGTKTIKQILTEHNVPGVDYFVEGKSEYLPIPVSELQTNPKMVQNTGY